MRKRLLFILPLLVLSAAVLAQKEDDDEEKPHKITISNSAFAPKALTIKKGETVRWTNADNLDHSIRANDGSFKSGTLKRKQSFEHTFKKAGKFPYACILHPREKGTIVVE
jgi:plastocyanin